MRKIIFILLFFAMIFSIFGNEKIINMKFIKNGGRKFYPIDENGKMDYGFYKYNIYEPSIPPEDETIVSFNGKVGLDLIEKLAKYHSGMRWGGLGTGLGLGFGALFLFGGGFNLYYAINISGLDRSLNTILGLALGIIFSIGSLIEFILGFICVGLMAYNVYHFKKTKKEIIEILNNDPTSIKTDRLKIRFVLNLGFTDN